MAKILIIDDDQSICTMLSSLVVRMGHIANCKNNISEALKEAISNSYDIVFLDVHLPDGNGLDILPRIRKTPSSPEVIIITGFGDADGAEMAIKYGAWDYLQKSCSSKDLTLLLNRILLYREGQKKNQRSIVALNLDGIIGSSIQMKACYNLVAQAANSNVSVLVTGETGTGKELFSNAVHNNSPRSNRSFVVVDCAALPDNLVESVLFGHVKGAFTGADRNQSGLIQQAESGTLFLDEVGELPLSVQKIFLRVLNEQKYRPVGSKDEEKTDFRVIAATNKDLGKMVKSGEFRKDLFFRLNALNISLPTLRERSEDITDIVLFHLKKICESNGSAIKTIAPAFLEELKGYGWPGNVRELVNALKTAVSAAQYDNSLHTIHLPRRIRIQSARSSIEKQANGFGSAGEREVVQPPLPSFRELNESTQLKYLQNLINHTKGNIKLSCEISCLSRSRLYSLMSKHHLSMKS